MLIGNRSFARNRDLLYDVNKQATYNRHTGAESPLQGTNTNYLRLLHTYDTDLDQAASSIYSIVKTGLSQSHFFEIIKKPDDWHFMKDNESKEDLSHEEDEYVGSALDGQLFVGFSGSRPMLAYKHVETNKMIIKRDFPTILDDWIFKGIILKGDDYEPCSIEDGCLYFAPAAMKALPQSNQKRRTK